MALTKVAGDILDPGIVVAGIVTATGFSGPFSNGTTGNFSGDVTVGGSLIVQGDQTTLNTTLRNVELLRVAANSSTAAGIITQTGSGDILNLFDGAAEVFSVADGGNVEINAGNLTLVKSSGALLELTTNTGAADATLRLSEGSKGSTTNGGGMFYSGADNKLYVTCGTDSTTKRITVVRDSGNVGINTTTPQTELEVFSDGFANLTIHSARTSGNIGGFDFSNGASAAGIQTAQYFVGTAGHHYWHCNGSERLKLENDGDLTITGVDNAELKLKCEASTGNNILAFLNSAGATKGRILYDSDNNFMVFNTNGTSDERMRITNAGAVGIGTNDPDTRLSVTAAVGTDVVGKFTSTDARAWIQFRDNSTTDTGVMVGAEGDNLLLRAGSNTRVTIDSSGHVLPNAAGTQNLGSTSKEWGDLYFANSKGLKLGSSQVGDLYNDGTDTYFRNSASNGQMLLRSDGNILISNYAANEYRIKTFNNGAVELYYDQSAHTTAKLSTTATGISVHGEVAASQDYPVIKPTLDLNFAAVRKLDSRITYSRTGPASYVDEFGKIVLVGDNVPRFDHDPTTRESRGLLMEESRTNMIIYSTDYTLAPYTFASYEGAISENLGTAPDGSLTDALIGEGNTGRHTLMIQVGTSLSNSTKYSMSIFVKRVSDHANERYCRLETANYSTWTHAGGSGVFDLSNGTQITSPGANITSGIETYPDGWFRIHFETTTGTVTSGTGFYLNMTSSTGSSASTTLTSSQGLFMYGTQMEAGAFPTSYIPTIGSTATRGLDYARLEGTEFSDFYNDVEGTIFVHSFTPTVTLGQGTAEINSVRVTNGSDMNHSIRYVDHSTASSAYIDSFQVVGGSNVVDHGGGPGGAGLLNKYYKHVTALKKDDYAYTFEGDAAINTDTSANMPTVNILDIGHLARQVYYKRIMYYPKRLPNSQLTTLVS